MVHGGWLQVTAYPSEYLGCEIPKTSYGGHGTPTVDESISFVLNAENGSTVTVFETGASYALTISSQKSTRAWIHASVGTVEALGVGIEPRACDQAWGSSHKASEHTVLWRAPKTSRADENCVVISTAVATGEKAQFQTNAVRFLLLTMVFWKSLTRRPGETMSSLPVPDVLQTRSQQPHALHSAKIVC